jgi:FtsH-binding integral membrane protein
VSSFASSFALSIARALTGASGGSVLVLGGVVVLGALLRSCAHSMRSMLAQYVSLAGFVVVLAVVFVPLLVAADVQAPGAIRNAVAATGGGFAALTAVAFSTRRDFHYLGALVRWALGLGLIAIISAAAFGFALGAYFSVAMLGMAGAAVLHDTSKVRHHLRDDGADDAWDDSHGDNYIAASLELFASIALMFWFALRLFSELRP